MKSPINFVQSHIPLLKGAGSKIKPSRFVTLVVAAFVWLGTSLSPAGNLLVNPGFENNIGHVIPNGWAYFSPPTPPGYFGDYYVEAAVPPHGGSVYYKQWAALGVTNASGIQQEFGCAPGSTYQASGWMYSNSGDAGGLGPDALVWMEVSFLNASSNLLALYKSTPYTSGMGLDTWFGFSVTNACNPALPVATGDPYFTTYAVTGSVSQIVAPAGATKVRFRFILLQSHVQGSVYFDDAVLNQTSGTLPPIISSVYPLNMIFVNPNDNVSFTASSPAGNTISAIHLTLNGTDVSSSLGISGSSSNKSVTYHGLSSNAVYNATISVTDSSNLTVIANSYFETTWVGVPPVLYIWEAEDFDFSSGMYINNPTLCNTSGNATCYFGKVGVEGVDEHKDSNMAPNHLYRASDPIGTVYSGDYDRKDHVTAGVFDYRIDPFNGSEWVSYTRDWPSNSYWIVGRLTTDISLSGSLTLSKVSNSTTNDLGTFSVNSGLGWGTYQNVFLKDANNNNAAVTLNGKTTLRLTSGGNLLPGFFMLVQAIVDLPTLSNVYPTGNRPFEYTNTFGFTVTAVGSSFPANGISLILDSNDVSSNLVITGSDSVKNVTYPYLLPNAIHTAIISATNALGHGIRVTNKFDTFNESNFMVEAEDFDYDSGQFVDPPSVDAYSGFGATTNVDYQHTTLDGEVFTYRFVGLPQDHLNSHDYLRQQFFFTIGDFVLVFFAGGDWGNYTRNYPAGTYYVYGRFSGGGPFTMYLDRVTSGTGTVNQVTQRLGQWSAVGKDYNTFDWVPLTDSGSNAPVAITLNGVATLRITTTGFCNPNYFMLVPAQGITLKAARLGNNVVISFPTQAGATYRVFYRTDLGTGNWVLLTSLLGDGTVKSVTDPSTAARRFYKVVAP